MSSKKILLLGASLESDNKGVNALGIGAITLLKNNYKDSEVNLLCVGTPSIVEKEININGELVRIKTHYFSKYDVMFRGFIDVFLNKIFRTKPKLAISKLIIESDIVFDINEGDSFSDIYGFKRVVRHMFDSKLILLWKKDLIFLPQTIGPFDTFIGKKFGGHILKRLTKLYVRDVKAYEFIDNLGVEKELTIDMAVYMQPQEVTEVKVKPNTIGVNVNGLMYLNRYKSLEGKYDDYPYFLTKLVKRLLDLNFEVLLIPHTYNAGNPNDEDDLVGIKKFMSDNKDLASKVSFVDRDYSAQQLKSIFSKLEFFMGSRMHSCIGALSRSIPTVGLAYSYKFEGTFNMFKQIECVKDVNYLKKENVDQLINEIVEFIGKRNEIKDVLIKENNRSQLKLKNTYS